MKFQYYEQTFPLVVHIEQSWYRSYGRGQSKSLLGQSFIQCFVYRQRSHAGNPSQIIVGPGR
jgi:hypothetical protein